MAVRFAARERPKRGSVTLESILSSAALVGKVRRWEKRWVDVGRMRLHKWVLAEGQEARAPVADEVIARRMRESSRRVSEGLRLTRNMTSELGIQPEESEDNPERIRPSRKRAQADRDREATRRTTRRRRKNDDEQEEQQEQEQEHDHEQEPQGPEHEPEAEADQDAEAEQDAEEEEEEEEEEEAEAEADDDATEQRLAEGAEEEEEGSAEHEEEQEEEQEHEHEHEQEHEEEHEQEQEHDQSVDFLGDENESMRQTETERELAEMEADDSLL